jgi:hypothetical protein
METYLKNKIALCENAKLYLYAEFYRNILKSFYNCNPIQFKKLIDYNIENSNFYYMNQLLEIKHLKK